MAIEVMGFAVNESLLFVGRCSSMVAANVTTDPTVGLSVWQKQGLHRYAADACFYRIRYDTVSKRNITYSSL
jgi:hypothetical protein